MILAWILNLFVTVRFVSFGLHIIIRGRVRIITVLFVATAALTEPDPRQLVREVLERIGRVQVETGEGQSLGASPCGRLSNFALAFLRN